MDKKNRRRLAQSKGLASRVSAERSGDLLRPCWAAELGEAYLLIPRWLLAKFTERTGKGLLNLKDLLAALPPMLMGLLRNELVLEALSGDQIVPNLTVFDQKRAANGLEQAHKGQIKGLFATGFLRTWSSPADLVRPRLADRYGRKAVVC